MIVAFLNQLCHELRLLLELLESVVANATG